MKCTPGWATVPFALLLACSSSSGAAGPNPGDSLDGAVGSTADGAVESSMSTSSGGSSSGGGSSEASRGSANSGPAGKAGVDAFCTALCDHEQTCAAVMDASASALAQCMSSCQSGNEGATAPTPTELYRADYLSGLGACIAAAACSVAINTAEEDCASQVVSGTGANPALLPTQAAADLCHAIYSSPCGPDSGAASCLGSVMLYSDTTLEAAKACFSGSMCTQVDSCYAAAFKQS